MNPTDLWLSLDRDIQKPSLDKLENRIKSLYAVFKKYINKDQLPYHLIISLKQIAAEAVAINREMALEFEKHPFWIDGQNEIPNIEELERARDGITNGINNLISHVVNSRVFRGEIKDFKDIKINLCEIITYLNSFIEDEEGWPYFDDEKAKLVENFEVIQKDIKKINSLLSKKIKEFKDVK